MLSTREKKPGQSYDFAVIAEPPFDVAIIGAGASGTLLAAQLRRNAPVYSRLALVGTGNRGARGIAYETAYRSHLLNVRAGNMSAFPDDMDHFVRWLGGRDTDAHVKTFAPRSVYGDYLADILNVPSMGLAPIQRFGAQAIDLTRSNEVWSVHLEDGSSILARTVVLALGNLPPEDPLKLKNKFVPGYLQNPWVPNLASGLAQNAPVLLIGTGLTMVDVIMSLREDGHRGHIYAISRHGRLPEEHLDFARRPIQKLPAGLDSPARVMRWLRREIEIAGREGYDWRAVIDGLRPHTSAIWGSWSLARRASFLRHARNLWDVHRHRIAPQIFTQIHELIAEGTLSIYRGRITSLYTTGQGLAVSWLPDGNSSLGILPAARVINCTGPARDYSRVDLPIVASLRESGWLTPDRLRLGVETDNDGRLLGVDGNPVDGLYTLGPLRIPGLWESIAIPEIRMQAATLARLLISNTIHISYSTHSR